MSLFLIDRDIEVSYDDLCNDVNFAAGGHLLYRNSELYTILLQLILALINDKDIVLTDNLIDSYSHFKNSIKIESATDLSLRIKSSKSGISLYTSGTSGQPKMVTHTVLGMIRNTRISAKYTHDVWGFAYSPLHMAGLQVFFQAVLNINPLINIFNIQRETALELIEKYTITHISATPTFYRMLLPANRAYLSVERVSLGGEKSDFRLYEELKKLFPSAKINNIYASTEAGALFSSEKDVFKIPENQKSLIIVEENELLIHNSLIGESDSFILEGDYYRTGDIIEWINKPEGLFKFSRRKNDMINVGGYKVNPREIEGYIMNLEGVINVIVYGKPNSVIGNILCADVVLGANPELNEATIKKMLAETLPDYQIPRIINFTSHISLTNTGKIKLK